MRLSFLLMRTFMRWVISFIFLFIFATPSIADELPSPVKVELVTDSARVKPGDILRIGVLFRMNPGWHVYWKNPGDSGLPTSVKFILPDGFRVGEILWPVPVSFKRAGGILDYGYEDSVFLSSVVNVPMELFPGSVVPIRSEVSWVACEEICIPGRTSLEMKLPVSDGTSPINAALFLDWDERLPIEADSANAPFVSGIKESSKARSLYSISLDWNFNPANVEWFPAPEDPLDIRNITVKTEKRQTLITFTTAILPGQKLSSAILETLLAYMDANGKRRGVNFPVPLQELNDLQNRQYTNE